jgi:hypothetical protein
LLVANKSLALGLAAHAVGLGLDHARRVALDPDSERLAEIERLLVGQPELSSELIHTDLGRHLVLRPSSSGLGVTILARALARARSD